MDTKDHKTTEKVTEANPQVKLMDKEPIVAAMEGAPELKDTVVATSVSKSNKYTIITVVIVVIALLVVLFQLERQDRVGTNVFGGLIAALEANAPVAVVNGEKLAAEDLEISVQQLGQTAVAQGLNPTDPQIQAEIQNQALEMLVNTVLLEQAAADRGIEVTAEEVEARVAELEEAAGGAEALAARLAEFEIDRDQLLSDVQEELLIRKLLDEVFAEVDLSVSEEEIAAVYNDAAAASGDQVLPPLTDVSAQIEQQLSQSKEQEALDGFIQELRVDADIELNS